MAEKEGSGDDFKTASESAGGNIGAGIKKGIEKALSAGSIEGIMRQIDEQYSTVAKTMGVGRESSDAIRQAFGDAYSDVVRIGGSMNDLGKMQNEVVKNMGRNVIMSSDYFDDLLAAEKTSQVSTDQLTKSFKDAGYNLYNVAKEMEGVVNTARSLGVSAEKVRAVVFDQRPVSIPVSSGKVPFRPRVRLRCGTLGQGAGRGEEQHRPESPASAHARRWRNRPASQPASMPRHIPRTIAA